MAINTTQKPSYTFNRSIYTFCRIFVFEWQIVLFFITLPAISFDVYLLVEKRRHSKQLNTVEEVGSPELEDAEREGNPFLRALDELSRQQQSGEGHKSPPPPDSPSGRGEQQQICMSACAPLDAQLSDFVDESPSVDDDDSPGDAMDGIRHGLFPYSSGSSPVASFRLAVRQSRAPSTCGKFNESLLGGLPNSDVLKSSLCVCTSIRRTAATASLLGEEEAPEGKRLKLKESPVTNEYKISHEIVGIGESGKVMACYHKRTGEKCALKVLRDNARSRRELELHWSAAGHPHVVSIGDMFENCFDGLKCLLVVVEFMGGGDLLTIFEENGRLAYSEKCVSRIVSQIGSAVQYLHDRNIAHRDIKLENILCSSNAVEQCTFKLADFGFAKRAEKGRLMESPCCTPAYVCPEILNRQQYDKGCDIWALGVATYILLCGYPPFYSMQGLPFSPGMRERITVGMFAFPEDEWGDVSLSTKNTLAAMLRTDPAERLTIEQLMSSALIRPAGQPPKAFPLPPVHSDSSISDGGFESAAETAKISSSAESGSDSHTECECKRGQVLSEHSENDGAIAPRTRVQYPGKDPKTVKNNALLERRRAAAAAKSKTPTAETIGQKG
uniref:non-specific serine/threonine protein kinase n=1 Tax=Globodera rostochiensis TaxID=31243 RepID=A0A914I2J0_GLORO